MTEVKDSAIGWVADHTKRYVESDGADGHDWNGVPASSSPPPVACRATSVATP